MEKSSGCYPAICGCQDLGTSVWPIILTGEWKIPESLLEINPDCIHPRQLPVSTCPMVCVYVNTCETVFYKPLACLLRVKVAKDGSHGASRNIWMHKPWHVKLLQMWISRPVWVSVGRPLQFDDNVMFSALESPLALNARNIYVKCWKRKHTSHKLYVALINTQKVKLLTQSQRTLSYLWLDFTSPSSLSSLIPDSSAGTETSLLTLFTQLFFVLSDLFWLCSAKIGNKTKVISHYVHAGFHCR